MTTGTYLEIDGRPALRFERLYPHPIDRVWSLVTDPGELVHWFPARVAFTDLRVGAAVHFAFPEFDGGAGTVLAHDPPHRFAMSWEGDELWFALYPTDDGGTRLTFTTVLAGRDTAARNAAGWELCLDAFGSASGAPGSSPAGAWREHYEAYLAQGVPSGAPIPRGGSDRGGSDQGAEEPSPAAAPPSGT